MFGLNPAHLFFDPLLFFSAGILEVTEDPASSTVFGFVSAASRVVTAAACVFGFEFLLSVPPIVGGPLGAYQMIVIIGGGSVASVCLPYFAGPILGKIITDQLGYKISWKDVSKLVCIGATGGLAAEYFALT